MRPGESDGHPYHFIDQAQFAQLKEGGMFVEYAQAYNDEWYGVQQADLERAIHSDKIVLWEVDFKGIRNIKRLYPEIKSFYISVPEEVFRRRLIERGDNPSPDYLESRIQYVREWAGQKDLYDYIIENEDGHLDQAVATIQAIIEEVATP
jgi:guanylate kinase